MRFVLTALVTLAIMLPSVAHADVPYWQARYWFEPFVRAIAVDPTNPDVVYVGASNGATYYGEHGTLVGTGIFRSTNGGYTFVPTNSGLPSLVVTALVVDPSNPNVLYAGLDGGGVAKTTNAGASYTPVNNGLPSLDVYALAIDPVTPTTLYAGLDAGGVYRSLDGGATWTASSGLFSATVYGLTVDPTAPATVYAASAAGVRKSTDGGATFAATGPLTIVAPGGGTPSTIGEVHSLVIDATDPAILVAGTHQGGGVFRSTNGGATWTHTSTGLFSEFGNWRFVNVIAQDPVSPAVFYASTTRETYRSHDGGVTWAPFDTGLSRGEAYAFGVHASGRVYTGSVFGEFHSLQVRPSGVNHFRCFQAKAKGFVPQPIAMADRFGTEATLVRGPVRYCVPTDPAGEGVVDSTAHLVCYKIGKGGFHPQDVSFLSQRIDGYRGYQVSHPETVCVPATVGGVPSPPHDAYRCLAGGHWKSFPIDLTLSDPIGSQLIRQHRTDRLCVPTDLDGAGENRIEPDVDLRCDVPQGKRQPFVRTTVTTTDRFGTLTLTLIKPDSHCFPALESRD
jgi:photosystem II stability/assembly factor-like uncharacterized protein